MGMLDQLDSGTIMAFQRMLGLPLSGKWDPETKSRVESYQTILNQTPGTTVDTPEEAGKETEWQKLVGAITARDVSFNRAVDSTPAQDLANQAFMREAGAQESEIADEIAFLTKQNARDKNLRVLGADEDRATADRNSTNDKTEMSVVPAAAPFTIFIPSSNASPKMGGIRWNSTEDFLLAHS